MVGSIVRAAIHPAIGIARVGTSPDEYLLAPQVPNPPRRPGGTSHDATGRLKREAVEFRIYGYDADGNVAAELTADNADISWTAHVANRKAEWFKFRHAMDLPSLADTIVERRNPGTTGPARQALAIDPGPRTIAGRSQAGLPDHRFDTGAFRGLQVSLGELRTDDLGRLLFLSGLGVSRSPSGAPPFVAKDNDAFGNAADWHDDVADGPVDATVRLNGVTIPVTGAWAVTAPPNYAPDLKSWRTLYDLLDDLYRAAGWLPRNPTVSFATDIYPILARLSDLQWVNRSFFATFGHGGAFDFGSPDLIDKISRIDGGAADTYRPLREGIFGLFREETETPSDPRAWPWLYGDSYGTSPPQDPYRHLAIGGERLRYLRAWLEGDFTADWGVTPAPPDAIDLYPLAEQPAALDRAVLDFCAADAFHPGIELTWPMRHLTLYSSPFRIRRAEDAEPDYGQRLDVATALGEGGPLHGQFPGSLTRWMLLPWQIDTGGCLAGYEGQLASDAPAFWPARVPNNVLSRAGFARATDPTASPSERVRAFGERVSWFQGLGPPADQWGPKLINEFGRMGVVEAHPNPIPDAGIPSVIYVQSQPVRVERLTATPNMAPGGPADAAGGGGGGGGAGGPATAAPPPPLSDADRRAQAAGFADAADREAMLRMRFGG